MQKGKFNERSIVEINGQKRKRTNYAGMTQTQCFSVLKWKNPQQQPGWWNFSAGQKTTELQTLLSKPFRSSTQKGALGHIALQKPNCNCRKRLYGTRRQKVMAHTKKEPGLKLSESPHLPLETPVQHHTYWGFAFLLSPNLNAKPGCNHKPRQTMCHQKGPKQWPTKNDARTKSFRQPSPFFRSRFPVPLNTLELLVLFDSKTKY